MAKYLIEEETTITARRIPEPAGGGGDYSWVGGLAAILFFLCLIGSCAK